MIGLILAGIAAGLGALYWVDERRHHHERNVPVPVRAHRERR
jgi:hypothetical protein